MTGIIVIILWSLALIGATWLAARYRVKHIEPEAVQDAAAQAVQEQVAKQEQVLKEIQHDVAAFDLSSYLNRPKPEDKSS